MKSKRFEVEISFLLLLTLGVGCSLLSPPKAPSQVPWEEVKKQIRLKSPTQLTAGAAKVEITPPVGTPLAGYSKRGGKPSQGIRDPLYVRALALSDGEDQAVLVSADLLIFPQPMADSILDKVCRELKLPRQAVILTTTHTHSGSGSIAPGFLYELVFGAYRPEVVEGITARLIWAVRQSLEHRQPVRWGAGSGEKLVAGLTENRMIPMGPVDTSMNVLLLESLEGHPVAILVNAAAHPTLLDSQDMRLSADYPGELTRVIETTYPGAVCLFVNGAAGDLRPKDAIGSTPEERVGRFGQALAEGATGLINQMSLKSKGDLAVWGWRLPLPPPQIYVGPIPLHPEIGRLMRPSAVYLNFLAFDHTLLVPLPAELTTELGHELKNRLAAQKVQPILLGYANGYLGYAVTPQQYQDRSYEARMTWYGPTFGVSLIDEIQQLAGLYPSKEENPKQ